MKKLEINPGDTFENKHWRVIREVEKKNGNRCFSCECLLCNREYKLELNSLRKKDECFCCRSCAISQDLTGQKFGRLTIISKHSQYKNGRWKYNCICDCGNEKIVLSSSLKNGNTQSCGCYNKERSIETNSGENHPNWRGGITPQNQLDRNHLFNIINPLVRERDKYTCQKCSQYKGWLEVHHIFDFATYEELRFEIDNLITLCKNCHDDFHAVYPVHGTNTLNDLEVFLGHEFSYRSELIRSYNLYYN
jgi:hypothetical protein